MQPFQMLLAEVAACTRCSQHLPHGPRPVVQASPQSRLLIVGQAPGRRVHDTGIPWNDPSGDRLRDWLQLPRDLFYDAGLVAIIPTGFCYPGKGKSGDLPPRPECAPAWHPRLLPLMPRIGLTLLIGSHAQKYYLRDNARTTLTATVAAWQDYLPRYLPLPHPSPRNQAWWKANPWFERELLPALRAHVQRILKS